jgi:hypothetical protein
MMNAIVYVIYLPNWNLPDREGRLAPSNDSNYEINKNHPRLDTMIWTSEFEHDLISKPEIKTPQPRNFGGINEAHHTLFDHFSPPKGSFH